MPNPKKRYERLGLERVTLDGEQATVIDSRIDAAWSLHIGFGCERLSIEHLAERVRKYGRDCYYQGLIDASSPQVVKAVRSMHSSLGVSDGK